MRVLSSSAATAASGTKPAAHILPPADQINRESSALTASASTAIPAASAELTIKQSVFRAEVFYMEQAADAKALVKRQKERYRDARHVVHAFIIGETGSILGCSDDGEPAGTAGQPVLAVLKGSGITNIMITVTRWFGGILLGTGGLVKAYSNAAKAALDQARTEPLIKKLSFTLECRYEDYQPLLHAAASLPIQFGTAEFLQTVCVNGSIPLEHRTAFERLVTEITKGASAVHFMDTVLPE